MSRIYSASQYEQNYLPHRLGNWELPSTDKEQKISAETRYSTLRPRSGHTQPIVDERGHLVPGTKKIMNSFNPNPKPYEQTPARWPQTNTTIRNVPAATMGYKGIPTDYLPTSTVTIKTVELPGCKQAVYH